MHASERGSPSAAELEFQPEPATTLKLHEFLIDHREELVAHCKAKVASRSSPPATEAELHGVPIFLEQLIDALRSQLAANPEIGTSAGKHGRELLRRGFTVAQVVRDYGDVCQAVTELAVELQAPIAPEDFQILNRCLDDAVADAVTEYAKQVGRVSAEGEAERLGSLSHELRNLVNTAILTFSALKTGSVGIGGSTAAAHERSLLRMKKLIATTLTDVQLDAESRRAEEITIADVIDDVVTTADIEAKAFPVRFTVEPVRSGAMVMVDRSIIAAALTNLLHNAFKFTRAGGRVVLRTRATADRVLFDVEDECGGLTADPESLFRSFEQFNADRSGVGLGLGIAHRGVKMMGGTIHVQNQPGIGCVFTVDLPRVVPQPATTA